MRLGSASSLGACEAFLGCSPSRDSDFLPLPKDSGCGLAGLAEDLDGRSRSTPPRRRTTAWDAAFFLTVT